MARSDVMEIISAEKERIQEELDAFFTNGAWVVVLDAEKNPLGIRMLVPRMRVKDVKVVRPDDFSYTVEFAEVGGDHTHILEIDEFVQEDTNMILAVVRRGDEVIHLRLNNLLTQNNVDAVRAWREGGGF